jgi:hypothetical protein
VIIVKSTEEGSLDSGMSLEKGGNGKVDYGC